MGKKNKKKEKSGAEKTSAKTEKNALKKAKKSMKNTGEEDIEALIAQFQDQDLKKQIVVDEKCEPPIRRSNMTLTAHPDKDELMMFGGENYIGHKLLLYNDLFVYKISKNEWHNIISPEMPPPRCSHQAVVVKQGGGSQLWVFGGEFASPSQTQFHHYKDLWMLDLKTKLWTNIKSKNPPSARSGHRMVVYKRLLIVFGGFHDNAVSEYRYYNDVNAFNLDTYEWTKLDISGTPPPPRSACIMSAYCIGERSSIMIFGGYSKLKGKKDADSGVVHTDMFSLSPLDKREQSSTPHKWRWQPCKQTGNRPSPRSGCALASPSGATSKAYVFGGVFDKEIDDETMKSTFYNDLYEIDLEKNRWFKVRIGIKPVACETKKRRRKVKDNNSEEIDEDATSNTESSDEEELDPQEQTIETTNGIFIVKIGPQSVRATNHEYHDMNNDMSDINDVFTPSTRMNSLLQIKSNKLFVYGGFRENNKDEKYTLHDMYCLDLKHLDKWVILREDHLANIVLKESESESEESEQEDESESENESEEEVEDQN